MKFKHKGLRALFEHDDARRVPPDQVRRLRHILLLLAGAETPSHIDSRPGHALHRLKGDPSQWAMRVSGNWRVVFRFEAREAVDVDLVDYH